MPPAKQTVAARSTAGVAFAAGVVVALILCWLRYPGLVALWASCIAAASFAVSPTYTGAKGPDGQPAPAGLEERAALRYRAGRCCGAPCGRRRRGCRSASRPRSSATASVSCR